ncbi:J domain-containing protein [Sphingomonas abaci]|uniref:DnaJ-domain-containing protein 1 n=1 Tax=Sphingomonas abaci TaxID=237611 RepID=A0A7W7AJQ4_9SPHN|nr:J domain-containing protein [Sphingomonas abaci]MBB4618328.1 DnaJ-domain-containing protein 1 [Sphingomonas abaci]
MKWLVAALLIWAAWTYLKPSGKRRMAADEAEARAVLGVGPRADAAAIRAAHRRLLAGVHPDRGGSAELAQRVNAARDRLLGPSA